jgi:N-acetylglucosamine malate deacetylase 1
VVTAEPLSDSLWARARWLVLAPHPDDETLGVGALIGQAAAADRLAGVAYLTDGSGSHPAGTPGIVSIRRAEARRALRRLASGPVPIDWIGWRDAHPHDPASAPFVRDAMRLGARLRRQRIDAVAVTAETETHCDHVAAFRLAAAAIRLARRRVTLFVYHVWSDPTVGRARKVRTRPLPPGRRRHALHAHCSQLSPAYGPGFRLPAGRRHMTPFDTLTRQRTLP